MMGPIGNRRSIMFFLSGGAMPSEVATKPLSLGHLRHKYSKRLEYNKLCLLLTHNFYLSITKDVAAYIKREFDKKYNPTWHVIVGRNFGSYVTHETKHFIYFYLGQVAILLFKSG